MPQDPKKSLAEIVQTIAEKVEVQLEPSDIDVVHLVPTKEPTKSNIIVRFVSRSSRDKLLLAAKKKRLTTSDFVFADASPVYINEHLCPEYKALLGKAIAKKKEKKWKFVWVAESKILARETENSSEGKIRHPPEMQPYGYKGKLYSFLRNFAVEEKFVLVQESNLGPPPN